jgi:hypothetical protein
MNCLNQHYSSCVGLEYHKDFLCFLKQFGGKISPSFGHCALSGITFLRPLCGGYCYCCVGMLLLISLAKDIYFSNLFTHEKYPHIINRTYNV